MSDDIQNLFDPSHFDSIEIAVQVENPATHSRTKPEDQVELCELSAEAIVLQIPRKLCAPGHHLLVDLSATVPGERSPFKMQLTAKVDEVERLSDADRVSLTPKQYEEKDWAKLLSLFSARQEAITDFLASARGY